MSTAHQVSEHPAALTAPAAIGDLEAPRIPYPHRYLPPVHGGWRSTEVGLPGGITVFLHPAHEPQRFLPNPLDPRAPQLTRHERQVALAAAPTIEPSIAGLQMQIRNRSFRDALGMLDRLAPLPPAVDPEATRPTGNHFARLRFPDREPRLLTAADWQAVRQEEQAWIRDIYTPALATFERNRRAIWEATR